ncbi:thioredoxin fold domain-containing protein [Croceitalea sp. MTPC5]|uniref:thioredoxin family protein n=1 Tax=Croceitalea sp. MTPC5 TaxID=3056565 RepID=UPI002B3FF4D0|nr:thioredoxin fold domain-containing protein [Croceitalea sp. MTPC5]
MRSLLITLTLLFSLTLTSQEVQWISWDEAVALSKSEANPKKIFVDVYTDWCGWCKKMDKDTFQNPKVAAYMAENFYMVKMDAEGKEPIEHDGKTFNFIPQGKRGYHELAAALLQGKMSYPTVVFLDEELKMLSPVPGYQKVKPFLQIARYFGDDIYKEKDWKAYSKTSK